MIVEFSKDTNYKEIRNILDLLVSIGYTVKINQVGKYVSGQDYVAFICEGGFK